LQNSLLELYGLSTLVDEHLFGDINAFRSQYASAGSHLDNLRQRLAGFCKCLSLTSPNSMCCVLK